MRLLTMSHWSTETGEHFTMRTDTPLSSPQVSIEWVDDKVRRVAPLIVTSVQGKVLNGYVATQIEGSFSLSGTIGRVEIIDGKDKTETPEVENPVEKVETELVTVSYDSLEINYDYVMDATSGGYTGVYTFINRLADSGNSGLVLSKNVAEGWALPGVLEPEEVDDEGLAEILGGEFSEDSGNRYVKNGSDLVFIRSLPSGNFPLRIPLSSVYSFEVDSSVKDGFNSDSRLLEQASFMELQPVREYDTYYRTSIDPPDEYSGSTEYTGYFYEEWRDIFWDNYPTLGTDSNSYLRAYVPQPSQDRDAEKHFSIQRRNHNIVEGT